MGWHDLLNRVADRQSTHDYFPVELVGDVLEAITGAVKQIDNDHAYIHEGRAFDTYEVVDINATRKYQLTTPSTTEASPYVHFRPMNIGIASGSILFQIFKGATDVSGGASLDPVNRNHNSTKTSKVVFKSGITSTSGSEIYKSKLHAGTGPGQTQFGANKGEPLEWVFSPNTNYVVYLTTTASVEVVSNFFWYEEGLG